MSTINTTATESPIGLMSLPPEIRKEIFTLLFEEEGAIASGSLGARMAAAR